MQAVMFIPCHENVAKAMQLIDKGQVHAARAVLGHDDVSSAGVTHTHTRKYIQTHKIHK